MTAVQWYAIENGKLEVERAKGYLTFSQMFNKMLEILNQAKAMEKEQIINSFVDGADKGEMFNNENRAFTTDAEQYYNETFNKQ